MAQNSPVDELLADFFAAVNLRNLAKCQAILTELNELAAVDADVRHWAQFCHGILLFEEARDWAAAERLFTAMLQSNLDAEMRARALYAVGRTYIVQGRWSLAIDAYAQLLATAATLEQPIDLIKAHRQTAIAYYRGYVAGDFDADVLHLGVHQCRKALDLLAPLETDNPPKDMIWLAGSVWSNLGVIYFNLEAWDSALECYQHDLACCRQLDDRHGIGLTLNNIGEVYHRQTDNARGTALSMYLQALELVREFGNAYEELDVLRNLGQLHCDMGDDVKARQRYQQAVTLIERLRTNVTSAEGRAGFFSTVVDTYAKLVKLLITQGEFGLAFDMTERARSRTFIEMLANHPIGALTAAPPQLTAKERRLRKRLRQAYTPSADQTITDSAEITVMEAALAEVQRQLRLLDVDIGDLHTVEPLTHAQVQQRLPPTTALLAYFDSGEALLVFVLTRDALTNQPLSLTSTQLRNAFNDQGFLRRLTPGADGKLHKPWLLEQLYTHLIAPVADHLRDMQQLIILPSGPLHFVPFPALVVEKQGGKAHALMDEFEILYAPSATVLLKHCQRPQSTASRSALTIGYNARDLRYAQAEAATIAKLVHGAALLDQDATQAALLDQAGDVRWLHLSCHGRFNAHAPLTSHLQLADGPFYAADILRTLRLHAELVTLSACETGRSQVLRGEELIGMVRAFLFAGAPSVLVTLWPVDEVSTIILMLRFYANLLDGQTKTAALRGAQQYLRKLSRSAVAAILDELAMEHAGEMTVNLPGQSEEEPIFSHPYYWAPFVLMGDRMGPESG